MYSQHPFETICDSIHIAFQITINWQSKPQGDTLNFQNSQGQFSAKCIQNEAIDLNLYIYDNELDNLNLLALSAK